MLDTTNTPDLSRNEERLGLLQNLALHMGEVNRIAVELVACAPSMPKPASAEVVVYAQRLLKTLPPMEAHAKFSIEKSRVSPATHQQFVIEDRENWEAYQSAKHALAVAVGGAEPNSTPGGPAKTSFGSSETGHLRCEASAEPGFGTRDREELEALLAQAHFALTQIAAQLPEDCGPRYLAEGTAGDLTSTFRRVTGRELDMPKRVLADPERKALRPAFEPRTWESDLAEDRL